jgi:hypothetical protein
MTITLTSTLLTYVVWGLIGFSVSKKIKSKPRTMGWILLVTFTILSQWILPGTRVIAIFQFEMYANQILQGFLVGLLGGLLLKKVKP